MITGLFKVKCDRMMSLKGNLSTLHADRQAVNL